MKKTALVTGGAGGIGSGIVRSLASDGWRVLIHYYTSEKRAKALAAQTGGAALQADLREPGDVQNMFGLAGDVDLLVNNAGAAHYGLITDITPAQWRALFAVNVDGAFHCIQCALPYMISQKRGKIINISSIWGIVGASCEVAYSATKAAIIGLTKALAKEAGPSGIQVNCIAPGPVETDMMANFTAADRQALAADTPLGRLGTSGDIGAAAAFLASPGGDFITGQVLSINGGFVI